MANLGEILRKLSEADRKIGRLHRNLQLKPAEIRNDQAIFQQSENKAKLAKDALDKVELEIRAYEKDCAVAEGERKKSAEAQNAAKSNEEYQAHQRKIESLQNKISDLETIVLESYERRDSLAKALEREKNTVKTAAKILEQAKGRNKTEQEDLQIQVRELIAERAALIKSLSGSDRDRYQTTYKAFKGETIVAVIDDNCQGCYVKLRPNDLVRLQANKELILCNDCGKVLRPG